MGKLLTFLVAVPASLTTIRPVEMSNLSVFLNLSTGLYRANGGACRTDNIEPDGSRTNARVRAASNGK